MSSVKKQKYRLSKIKDKEVKRLRDAGIVRLSVPEPKLSNVEILMTCVDESSSSFGIVSETKEEEAMQTNWFGFDQETMLRCIKVLIHKENMKKVIETTVRPVVAESSDKPIDMTGKSKEEVDAFLLADHKQWTVVENLQVTL